MAKDNDIPDVKDFEYVTTELERMHPEKGDIFVLNVNTDDHDILYSEEIMDSVEKLSDALFEFTGIKIPILVFGNEMDLSIMSKSELKELVERLDELEDDDDYEDEEDELDSEHLTDQFN